MRRFGWIRSGHRSQSWILSAQHPPKKPPSCRTPLEEKKRRRWVCVQEGTPAHVIDFVVPAEKLGSSLLQTELSDGAFCRRVKRRKADLVQSSRFVLMKKADPQHDTDHDTDHDEDDEHDPPPRHDDAGPSHNGRPSTSSTAAAAAAATVESPPLPSRTSVRCTGVPSCSTSWNVQLLDPTLVPKHHPPNRPTESCPESNHRASTRRLPPDDVVPPPWILRTPSTAVVPPSTNSSSTVAGPGATASDVGGINLLPTAGRLYPGTHYRDIRNVQYRQLCHRLFQEAQQKLRQTHVSSAAEMVRLGGDNDNKSSSTSHTAARVRSLVRRGSDLLTELWKATCSERDDGGGGDSQSHSSSSASEAQHLRILVETAVEVHEALAKTFSTVMSGQGRDDRRQRGMADAAHYHFQQARLWKRRALSYDPPSLAKTTTTTMEEAPSSSGQSPDRQQHRRVVLRPALVVHENDSHPARSDASAAANVVSGGTAIGENNVNITEEGASSHPPLFGRDNDPDSPQRRNDGNRNNIETDKSSSSSSSRHRRRSRNHSRRDRRRHSPTRTKHRRRTRHDDRHSRHRSDRKTADDRSLLSSSSEGSDDHESDSRSEQDERRRKRRHKSHKERSHRHKKRRHRHKHRRKDKDGRRRRRGKKRRHSSYEDSDSDDLDSDAGDGSTVDSLLVLRSKSKRRKRAVSTDPIAPAAPCNESVMPPTADI